MYNIYLALIHDVHPVKGVVAVWVEDDQTSGERYTRGGRESIVMGFASSTWPASHLIAPFGRRTHVSDGGSM
jgi:hypothetical protein